MALTKSEFKEYLSEFNFRQLFVEMGWNNDSANAPVTLGNLAFSIKSVAEKRGFKILVCSPPADGPIPDYVTRKKIEAKVTRLFQEHLIIYHDAAKTEQIWQWVARQSGKPARVTETRWNASQEPELLFQRASGIFFELDEEENINIVEVTQKVEANFDQNNEKVTKRFYEVFKKQHTTFYYFLSGIDDHIDEWNRQNPKKKKENINKQWYVSLMLNRLMFCYFIQKKGFLNRDKNYLRNKLIESKTKRGNNKYYSFYRDFLLALFHDGLGAPEHSTKLKGDIGTIPYLNGGLFDTHQLERDFDDIEIEDEAFEKIFDFFDQYEWHLDTRHTASGKDINPDVIGYIFEKYINDRAQMGAYYTKEDITDYISKNCILPFLFDETKRNYPKAFTADGEIWSNLKTSGDDYIYKAVKHGLSADINFDETQKEHFLDQPRALPKEIEIGLDTTNPSLLDRRKDWNRSAPSSHGLPTEIWREVVDRRRRCTEAKEKIESGEITEINDFITYNLNIRQFAQDVVDSTNDPKFLEHFYKALSSVTILDPTCGSGAFLFAAMNILEPLYSSCLQRMRNFIEDEDRANLGDKKTFGHKFPYFREVLEEVQNPAHPNLQYFIFKTIILRNLYGVDIMKEAVEVAKLRLFLKLVATVEADYRKPNLGLEPLPDIDFNIRAGNTLVGFANEKELDDALLGTIQGQIAKPLIDERMEIVSRVFKRFKQSQVTTSDYRSIKDDKGELYRRLGELNDELSRLCHEHSSLSDFDEWVVSHQPFHWLAEFYEIICQRRGFDVIIGNPPYVEYSKVRYKLKGYETLSCGNLYAYVTERCERIINPHGGLGMIVQLPIVCTDRMIPLQRLLLRQFSLNCFSTFDDRPGKLFDGLEHIRAAIFISSKQSADFNVYTTKYLRWNSEFRAALFQNVQYRENKFSVRGSILKIGEQTHESVFSKMLTKQPLSLALSGDQPVYFHNAPQYWIRATDFVPYFWNERDGEKASVQIKSIYAESKRSSLSVNGIINSSLFYLWFISLSDCRHLNMREIEQFPSSLAEIDVAASHNLSRLVRELMSSYEANKRRKATKYKTTGVVEYDEYFPRYSKPIIDEIDEVLAGHYGFSEEELDFIINYDIKYRMGRELISDSQEELFD